MVLISALVAGPRVVVVTDGPKAPYRTAADAVRANANVVETLSWDDASIAGRIADDGDLRWIAIGPRSAASLRGCRPGQCVATLVRARDVPEDVAAVTVEVPVARQLGWVRSAFPGRRRAVILRQPGAVTDDGALRSAADAHGVEVVLVDVANPGEAVAALENALREQRRETVVWLLPDPVAVNADTVAPLIQAAMAHRAPVVGFSSYFLRVGALAAVDVDIGAAAAQALALLDSEPVRAAPAAAVLRVNGRLAERLGVRVTGGDGVEVER